MFGWFKRKEYLDWDEYQDRVNKIDNILFIDKVAKQSIKNMGGVGKA